MSFIKFFILATLYNFLPFTSTDSVYAFDSTSIFSEPRNQTQSQLENKQSLRHDTPKSQRTPFLHTAIRDTTSRDHAGVRFLTQSILGSAAATAGLHIAMPLVFSLVYSPDLSQGYATIGLIATAAIPVITTSAIIFLIGKGFDGNTRGSIFSTIAGTVGGGILALGLLGQIEQSPLAHGLVILPALGGTTGYTLSRSPHRTGVINICEGNITPGVPGTDVLLIPRQDGRKALEYRMNMLNVSF